MIKKLSSTYLRDIDKYVYSLYKYNDYCIVVKKKLQIKTPFILNEEGENITLIDNNYYILEYVPFYENYICRFHIDDNLNIVERFYIASLNNYIEDGIPMYEDLKLSYVCTSKINKLYNQDIIESILNDDEKDIAYKAIKKIQMEISNKNNFAYNLDYKKYLVEE